MSAEEPIDLLTRSILDELEIDWDRAEAETERAEGIGRVRALRDVARIASFHRSLQREPEDEDPALEPDAP